MANKSNTKQFRGDLWFQQQIHPRVKAALAEQEQAFARDHQQDTDQQLLDHLRQLAAEFGRTPNACEVIGGSYFVQRFGSWKLAVQAAELPPPGYAPQLTNRRIYIEEFKRQANLFKQERRAGQEASQIAQAERRETARQNQCEKENLDLDWGRAHETDTDEQLLDYVRQEARRLGHSPVGREVLGSTYIIRRFGSWPLVLTCAGLPLPAGMKPPKQAAMDDYRAKRKTQKIQINSTD